jgi:hypothetical protein
MTTEKLDLRADNFTRLNAGNAWGLVQVGDVETVDYSKKATILDFITKADKAYITHDLPQPIVRDIFASDTDRRVARGNGWEGIAVAVILLGYAVLGGGVIFKIATFGSLFVG